jgi:hypothetical protein
MVQKYKDDDEVIRGLHSIVFATVGTKGQRKKYLKLFSGLDDSRSSEDIESKFTQSRKKWTMNLLKEACDLLGLDKGGNRVDICKRLADYLVSPTETKSESEVPATKVCHCFLLFLHSLSLLLPGLSKEEKSRRCCGRSEEEASSLSLHDVLTSCPPSGDSFLASLLTSVSR